MIRTPAGEAPTAEVGRREALRRVLLGLSGLLVSPLLSGCSSGAKDVTPSAATGGQSPPVPALARFDGSRPAGPPTRLPRAVAWANTTHSEAFVALGQGMEAAARTRGLEYLTAIAADDPARNIDQMETFLARGVAGMTVQPLDQTAQRPVMERALDRGVCVLGIITHPSTVQVAASQYQIGFTQGKAAADHARTHLGGRAEAHYFSTAAWSPQLELRRRGVLDGLRTAGDGVRVVSEVVPRERSVEGAFALMTEVLQKHPDITIVLGSDIFVVGAYRAMEQAGRLTAEMYLAGVNGDANALALVKEGGPYRASQAFAWRLMGYGMGWFTADWVEGKEIPRVMVANPILLDSPAGVDRFLADTADPGPVFAERERYEEYLPLLGNVSYATRETVWREDFVPQ